MNTFFDGFGTAVRVASDEDFRAGEKSFTDADGVVHNNPDWNESAEVEKVKAIHQKAISQRTREKILSGFVFSGNGKRYATSIEDQLNWTSVKAGIDDQDEPIITITADKEPTPMTKIQFLAAYAEGEANKKAILASDVAKEIELAACQTFADLSAFEDNR